MRLKERLQSEELRLAVHSKGGHARDATNIIQLISVVMDCRMVEQTSVHEVLKFFGEQVKVPPVVCRIIHTRVGYMGWLTLEQLIVDTRLWDFSDRLIAGVDEALRRAELLGQDEVGSPASHSDAMA